MGLDSVFLVMEIEKYFNIRIPDSEAEQATTPRKLAEIVRKYVAIYPDSKCRSQILFYILRMYFHEEYNFDVSLFKPNTTLEQIFPSPHTVERWSKLETDFDIVLPELSNKGKIERWFTSGKQKHAQLEELIIYYNVRSLINWILSINHHDLINKSSVFSEYEIERIIIGITSNRIGIPIEDIQPDSKFVEDLGIDA